MDTVEKKHSNGSGPGDLSRTGINNIWSFKPFKMKHWRCRLHEHWCFCTFYLHHVLLALQRLNKRLSQRSYFQLSQSFTFKALRGYLPVCNHGLTAVGLSSPGVTVHVCASVAWALLHMTVHECWCNSIYVSAVPNPAFEAINSITNNVYSFSLKSHLIPHPCFMNFH